MARKPLCDDQIYKAIWQHWTQRCLPPSLEYLCQNSCIGSKNTMFLAIRRLARSGLIRIVDGKSIPVEIYNSIKEMGNESEESEIASEGSGI